MRYGGLSRVQVVGLDFFGDVAPCMNNYMIAERFEGGASVDITLPYVLTFRMRPTPVQIRLLRTAGSSRRWVLVARD
jgi:photoactive yellow protein